MLFEFGILSGWNRRLTSTFIDIVQQLVTVIPTVCQYIASLYINMLQHRNGVIDIIALSFAEHDIQRIAIGIYGRMDFSAGTSPAVSNLIGRPLFSLHYAGAPVRWKRPGTIPGGQPPGLKVGRYYREFRRQSIFESGCKRFPRDHSVLVSHARAHHCVQSRWFN